MFALVRNRAKDGLLTQGGSIASHPDIAVRADSWAVFRLRPVEQPLAFSLFLSVLS
jgi:hypothetical protein